MGWEQEVEGDRGVISHNDLGSHEGTAADFVRWASGDWGIENVLPLVPDVAFCEDCSRIRAENAEVNLR